MPEAAIERLVRTRIRALRKERGLTQEALCEKARISVDAVTRIENGSRVPTLDTLQRIASALGVGVDDLVRDAAAAAADPPTVSRLVALLHQEPPEVQEAVEEIARVVVRIGRHHRPAGRARVRAKAAPQQTTRK